MKQKIKFESAYRVNENVVCATYSFGADLFSVKWANLNASGEPDSYDLLPESCSKNYDIVERVDSAIMLGETDDNPDLDLYLFIRDTFSSVNCEELD